MAIYLQYSLQGELQPHELRSLLVNASYSLEAKHFEITPKTTRFEGSKVFSVADFSYRKGRDFKRGSVICCGIEKLEIPESMPVLDSILSSRDYVGQLKKIGVMPDAFILFLRNTGGYFGSDGYNGIQSRLVEKIARYVLVNSENVEMAAILTREKNRGVVREVTLAEVIELEFYRKLTIPQVTG